MVQPAGPPFPLAAFAADKMLGRLARWLRILGHDVCWAPNLRGRALANRARREHRLLLTRDTRLVRERNLPPHLFITSDRFHDQLRQVADQVPLGGAFLRRCVACNTPVEEVSREVAGPHVPAYVLETQARVHRCPACRRFYWPATHRARIVEELSRIGLGAAAEEART